VLDPAARAWNTNCTEILSSVGWCGHGFALTSRGNRGCGRRIAGPPSSVAGARVLAEGRQRAEGGGVIEQCGVFIGERQPDLWASWTRIGGYRDRVTEDVGGRQPVLWMRCMWCRLSGGRNHD
jgi:hypothetical protein